MTLAKLYNKQSEVEEYRVGVCLLQLWGKGPDPKDDARIIGDLYNEENRGRYHTPHCSRPRNLSIEEPIQLDYTCSYPGVSRYNMKR